MITSHFPRGFLPSQDPVYHFELYPEFEFINVLGRDLPSLLLNKDFREYVSHLNIPFWPETNVKAENLPELRLYYLRLGFVVSGYINQVGQEAIHSLPENLALPFVHACNLLNRPPILSYDGYALYNWKRFDVNKPVELGNIDTLQNFVHLYDEHWFILIHVDIEAKAQAIVEEVENLLNRPSQNLEQALHRIAGVILQQVAVLKRIPEFMSPELYFERFRPYIRFFEKVTYQGVEMAPMDYRGETGAQSSIMPLLEALMKIPHEPSVLLDHLKDMRNYMPAEHRALLIQVESLSDFKHRADKEAFNAVLDAMASFRSVHIQWAHDYIASKVSDPRGTGGTPYMQWLSLLIDETLSHKHS
ncbi:hypothetical protein [Litoribacillus peritrichatus]|uniref:Indoleamine 2,3-dioxygenase n=1 Tax=Litoribacillus peritrichatus TaxID=718191 RepID=A0ABP7MCB0_9GAMM